MALFEHSAGGVVYRRVKKNIKVLLLLDKNKTWTFPKGLIEDNEDPIKTAKREIFEEVGLKELKFIEKIDTVGYFYRFKENLIRKKVDYFLFEYTGSKSPVPQKEEGISDAKWFDLDEALAIIGYPKTNKPVLEKALVRIQLWNGKKLAILKKR